MTVPLRTPAKFPLVGIGAGSLANAGGEGAFIETVRAAWERGVRYFDSSAAYLGGESEQRLGTALKGLPRGDLRLSTKLGRYQRHTGSSLDPKNKDNYSFDYSADATLRSVERSLARLKVDRLDAVYIHDLDPRFAKDAYDDLFRAALTGAYPALQRLREDNVIGAVGIAAMDWRSCLAFAEAADLDVVMPAGEHSLLRNQSGPLLDHCSRNGLAWIAASPFNSGVLATGAGQDAVYNMRPATRAVLDQVSALDAICRRHGVPLAAAALQYPLRHPAVTTIVFGAKSAAEFEETFSYLSLALPGDFWPEIDAFIDERGNWEEIG